VKERSWQSVGDESKKRMRYRTFRERRTLETPKELLNFSYNVIKRDCVKKLSREVSRFLQTKSATNIIVFIKVNSGSDSTTFSTDVITDLYTQECNNPMSELNRISKPFKLKHQQTVEHRITLPKS